MTKACCPALDARSRAQELAFSPVVFYAAIVMRDTGLLTLLARAPAEGMAASELTANSELSEYAVSILMDLAADAGIVRRQDDRLILDNMGYFLLYDTMTQVNINFVRDICYQALPFLEQSLREERPAGLHTLGNWSSVYEGLSQLKEPASSSWFRFDHYYSDSVFNSLLPEVFARPVERLLDIGANTGRWGLKCLDYDDRVHVVMVDLPGQLALAKNAVESRGFNHRVTLYPMDVLDDKISFPADCDAIWMSQFLDCFKPEEILRILRRLVPTMDSQARLYIVEPFIDRQEFSAASLSLNATSLYFTCVANGTSRMYRYEQFVRWLNAAGLVIENERHLKFGHSLLVCRVGN